ncbi:MAG: ABC transporter substrate-binding protein, partial [Promethearchaeota archaeon]
MKYIKCTIFLILLLLSILTLYNTTAKPSQISPIITIGTISEIITLDPAGIYDLFEANILIQLTHGLMEFPTNSLDAEKGPIVDSYSVSSDAKEYLFNLKSGLKFSDGTDFNATTMKWNLDRSYSLNGDLGYILTDVMNKTEVIDDDTLKITLIEPDGTFLQRLSLPVTWPVSPASLPTDTISDDLY